MANQLVIPLLLTAKEVDFLPVGGSKRSAYQQALARVSDTTLFAPPIIMTKNEQHIASRKQAEDMDIAVTVVVMPAPSASGNAIAAGAAIARKQSSEAVVLAYGLWSITDAGVSIPKRTFLTACRAASIAAADGKIVMFGISPTEPSYNRNYLRRGSALDFDGVHDLAGYVERPKMPASCTSTVPPLVVHQWNRSSVRCTSPTASRLLRLSVGRAGWIAAQRQDLRDRLHPRDRLRELQSAEQFSAMVPK